MQHSLQHDLSVHACRQQPADRACVLNACLDLINDIVRRAGQQLDDIAARRRDGLILPDQNAERTGRGDLFALGKIRRDILGNLAGDKVNRADIRLLHAKIPDHSECSVRADSRADVQLAGGLFQHGNLRVLDPAAHIALCIRHGKQPPQRPASLELERDGAVVDLLHIAHHGRRRQKPAECRCCGRKCFMDLPRTLDNAGRGDGDGVYKAVLRHGAYKFVFHSQSFFAEK